MNQPDMAGAVVLLVDDDVALLANLAAWLESSGYRVLSASSGQEALRLARQQPVDVAVLDLNMPGFPGLDVLTVLKELDPGLEVIIFSGQATFDDAVTALRHGRAFDLLRKPLREPMQLNLAIEKAYLRRHQARAAAASERPSPAWHQLQGFSDREREILAVMLTGADTREIADQVCLSEKTVRNYLSQIYHKLGVTSRAQAIIACLRLGLS